MLKYDLEYSKPGFFKGKYEINGDDVELEVKNKFGGVQNVFGEAYGKRMDIDIDSGFFGVRKGEVTGYIGDAPIYLKYQVIILSYHLIQRIEPLYLGFVFLKNFVFVLNYLNLLQVEKE